MKFKNILVVEDFDSINTALNSFLKDLGAENIIQVKYCDDALLKIKELNLKNEAFDLIITDLSFEEDFRKVKIRNGVDFIQELIEINLNTPVLVYSVENRPYIIQQLYQYEIVKAYVQKGRYSLEEIKKAINAIVQNNTFISPSLAHLITSQNSNEITDLDVFILKCLAEGNTIEEIELIFKAKNITPSSKSSIEKKMARLKDVFKANNNIHLISICKDLGVI